MRETVQRRDGYNTGYNSGFRAGYNDGYDRGRQVGMSGPSFEGTSIIIPTYNQLHYLRECITSIREYTPQPYELIVIDNGSDDGSADYIRSVDGIRYQLLPDNRGFAGAVNQGLMMARGATILILNNDSVVTTNWLGNLLICLFSNQQFGIVGPMTNYISGDQLISTHYKGMAEMQQFAEAFNISDSERWTMTGRLTGFCMLLRRETFSNLGYFDEGYKIGNCEDDDYGLRARLMGLQLIIAKDTFIHHYGSVSMKSLNSRFDEVYLNNLTFYSNKWSDPHGYLSLEWQSNIDGVQLRTIDFYPTCVIVRGVNSREFWVENGVRHPIDGSCGMEAIRVAQVDLRCWTLGEMISTDEVLQRVAVLKQGVTGDSDFSESTTTEGRIVKLQDGLEYQCKHGRLHRFINKLTLVTWKVDTYSVTHIEHSQHLYEEGPPILCPPVIEAVNI